ncbi:hypothetical protein BV898_03850 [Hypsibius exemplaris]|uniref:Mitochondrial import inner membrane translocase subunit n=1 Tax=Hypsibius exemplaris TaxID=2072580 RepID=A0A1W0X4E3_HYPEX|nr:hypothetical protein BV898_03850 [Hypsibius exemplaris]
MPLATPDNVKDASRNFKDFMRLYNQLTETCFAVCVADLGSRSLTAPEESCVAHCAEKNIRLNNRTMEIFMELQPAMLEKRRKEAEEAFALMEKSEADAVPATEAAPS